MSFFIRRTDLGWTRSVSSFDSANWIWNEGVGQAVPSGCLRLCWTSALCLIGFRCSGGSVVACTHLVNMWRHWRLCIHRQQPCIPTFMAVLLAEESHDTVYCSVMIHDWSHTRRVTLYSYLSTKSADEASGSSKSFTKSITGAYLNRTGRGCVALPSLNPAHRRQPMTSGRRC